MEKPISLAGELRKMLVHDEFPLYSSGNPNQRIGSILKVVGGWIYTLYNWNQFQEKNPTSVFIPESPRTLSSPIPSIRKPCSPSKKAKDDKKGAGKR